MGININDWYNDNEIYIDIDRETFIGWHYNHDYSKIYIDTDYEHYTWDCIEQRLL